MYLPLIFGGAEESHCGLESREFESPLFGPLVNPTGSRWLLRREAILRVGQEGVKFGLAEVDEGAAGRVREVHGEGTAQLDYDGDVV